MREPYSTSKDPQNGADLDRLPLAFGSFSVASCPQITNLYMFAK